MIFAGIQKLTLLDYPEKTACTVFTIGCNFACPFCQNASLIGSVNTVSLSPCVQEEIFDFLATRQGLLDGVCISGGEPLLQDDLESFIDKVKELGFLVKLDTNGSNPDKLKKLIESKKIDYVAMDIKNSPEKYPQTIGLQGYDISPIQESINIICKGLIPYEFRTTVVKEFHTEEDLLSIAHWISARHRTVPCLTGTVPCLVLQKFVDSEGVKQKGLHGYSDEEMQQLISAVKTVFPAAGLRGV